MAWKHRAWLCLPPLTLCALDACLTLHGQPPSYWQGDFGSVRELNPLFNLLLCWHPGAFLVGLVCWAAGFAAAILLLPPRLALLVAFGFAFGHACGAASWVVAWGVLGWVLAVLLLVSAERLVGWSWRRSGWQVPASLTVAAVEANES